MSDKLVKIMPPSGLTVKQWGKDAIGFWGIEAFGELQGKGVLGELGGKELAYYAMSARSIMPKHLAELPPALMSEGIQRASIRALANLPAYYYESGQAELATGFDGAADKHLKAMLAKLSLLYIGADVNRLDEADSKFLLKAAADLIKTDFASMSIIEIEEAFKAASARENLRSYGNLTLQLLQSVLRPYKTARDKALNAILDRQTKLERDAEALRAVADKNDAAFECAVADLGGFAIAPETCPIKHYKQCPAHFVRRMVEAGVIDFSLETKKEILRRARAYCAADVMAEAPTLNAKKAAAALFAELGVVPYIGEYVNEGALERSIQKAQSSFDYAKPNKANFDNMVGSYYSKLLYFHSIYPI